MSYFKFNVGQVVQIDDEDGPYAALLGRVIARKEESLWDADSDGGYNEFVYPVYKVKLFDIDTQDWLPEAFLRRYAG